MADATKPKSSETSSEVVERGRLPACVRTVRIAVLRTLQGTQRASAPNVCGGGSEFRGSNGIGVAGGDAPCEGIRLFTLGALPRFMGRSPYSAIQPSRVAYRTRVAGSWAFSFFISRPR